jgi:probable biosynthetic protein (TIGR04098 family)
MTAHVALAGLSPLPPAPLSAAEFVRLGMPHLALSGLSEGWLLRECGARHWSAIGARLGVRPGDLRDGAGHRLYPSFLATRLEGDPLAAFAEGDIVEITTHLWPLSPSRSITRHLLTAFRSGATVTVEMVSALLKRERARDNASLREADAPRWDARADTGIRAVPSELLAADKAIRNRARGAGGEADAGDDPGACRHRFRYRPLPASDFNGAGLLYFASYHAIVDRAEWDWRPGAEAAAWTTARRDTFFFANVNPGDEVEVVLAIAPPANGAVRHRARLSRVSDGRPIAEAITVKRALA